MEYFDPLIAAAEKRVKDGIYLSRHEDMDAFLHGLVENWEPTRVNSRVDTATVWCRDPDDTPAWAQGWTNSEAGGTMEDDLKFMGCGKIHWTVARQGESSDTEDDPCYEDEYSQCNCWSCEEKRSMTDEEKWGE